MTVSLKWIKELVNLEGLTAQTIAQRLTEAACEVEKIIIQPEILQSAIAVRIEEVVPIEGAPPAIKLARFTDGQKSWQAICGAPNAAAGLLAPFAPAGSVMTNGQIVEAKTMRGQKSHGILCSQAELGLGSDASGLLELNELAKPGQKLAQIFAGQADILFEIDNKSITHRPDLWSVEGLARELAAIFQKSFKEAFTPKEQEETLALFAKEAPALSAELQSPACLAYSCFAASGINGQASSPFWMRQRLQTCGIRPISALVDISNYVMLELGTPTHFFDKAAIAGNRIIVRQAHHNKEIITLDGQTRSLEASDILVCDSQKPLALAGIMGGQNSKTVGDTAQIVVEAAVWRGENIRKTSLRLGLRTDASIRYEKSLDPHAAVRAALRCAQLIKQVFPEAAFIGGPPQADGLQPYRPQPLEVSLDRINSSLGLAVTAAQAQAILKSLGFSSRASGSALAVTPPSFRNTKEPLIEADICEEIGRIYGYSKIKMEPPRWLLQPAAAPQRLKAERKTQDFFVLRARALEIFSHPMIGEKNLKRAGWPELNAALKLANSINPERDRMRPSLIPSFLEAAELNQKHAESFRFFETGRIFLACETGFSQERAHVGALFCQSKETPFLQAASAAEELLHFLELGNGQLKPDSLQNNPLVPESWSGLHPIERMSLTNSEKTIGAVFSLHPSLARQYKIKGFASLILLDLTDIMDLDLARKTVYRPLSKFQSSLFDCTVAVDNNVPAAALIQCVCQACIPFVGRTAIADIFNLGSGRKAVTLRSALQSNEATLKPEEIKASEDAIVEALRANGYPLKT